MILILYIVGQAMWYPPSADPSTLNTCRLMVVDDGILRCNLGSIHPSFSLIIYAGYSNMMVATGCYRNK